jgi:sulfhydrogenase subunit alpha
MTKTIMVNHLARVEGHGGIRVTLEGRTVTTVELDIFEGARLFETLVRGRHFTDVSQIVSRICAICSASHAVVSLRATESALGIEVSPQTELLRSLLAYGEHIASHALHLFLLAAPDYLNYPSAIALAKDNPEAVKLGLRLKKLGNTIQETIGGRAVHPVNAVPGGFATLPDVDRLIGMRTLLRQGVADAEAAINLLSTLPAADFCAVDGVFAALRDGRIVLDIDGVEESFAPPDYRRLTNETSVPHSHAKHSLYRGRPFLVGALARLTINRRDLGEHAAGLMRQLNLTLPSVNPMDNNKAQAVELALDIEEALRLVQRLLEEGLKPEPVPTLQPRAGSGTAVIEAPRGLLVHSYTYDEAGLMVAADVITPTAMNAASVESQFRRAAERGVDEETQVLTRRLEMLARACDPCLSCSVHVVQKRDAA